MTRLVLLLGGSGAVSIVVKATVVAALGLLGARLGRGSRAAVRHAVLGACFAALLGLPVASFLIPPVHLAVAQAPTVSSRVGETVDASFSSAPLTVNVPSVSRWSVPPAGDLLFAGWIVGAVCFLLRIVVGMRQVHVLRRLGLPWREGQSVVDRMAVEAGVHRRVEVLLQGSLVAPVTCGVVRPAVLLPPDARRWDGEDLGRAIVHELEHVRRWDWVSQCFARVVCAVYWFHPLVWMAWRRFVLEAERACDDAVLRRSEATAYADQLVELAQRLSAGGRSPALAMASRSDLSSRVRAVLDGRQRRGPAGTLLVMVACAAATVGVLTMSPFIVVAAPQSDHAAESRPEFEVASVKLNTSGSDKAFVQAVPGRLEITNVALRRLILNAYGGQDYQISGDPSWAGSDHYDIQATAAGSASVRQMQGPMLQRLLEARFRLKTHRETVKLPVYELTVAKSGVKLEHTKDGSCVPYSADSPPPPPVASGAPHPVFCGFPKLGANGPNRTLDGVGVSMEILAGALSRNYASALNRMVIDSTKLSGTFDLHLRWSVDSGGLDDPDTPSIFTVLQEQLGLKLVSSQGPVDVLVIDHVEKPSEN